MKRINIEQGTPEWHETRYGKVGGTKNKGLLTDSDVLLIALLGCRMEDYEDEDSFTSAAMDRGNELEPEARKQLNAYTGLEFKEVGWLQHSTIPLLGISPDGITDDDRFSAEIKCFGKDKHTRTIVEGVIPKEHINQCLHYFVINPKLEKHYFGAFRPENKLIPLFVKSITRDSVLDLGTKRKPDLKTVSEWVAISIELAKKLQIDIDLAIEKLKF
jgi:hypothetical protein